jgi:hypothetical protein
LLFSLGVELAINLTVAQADSVVIVPHVVGTSRPP